MKKKYLDKFIEIYKQEYGIELTEAGAVTKAAALINLYKAMLGDPLVPNNQQLNEKENVSGY